MPLDLTRDGLISAFKPTLLPNTKPELLRDVLRMKRNRGDADADQLKRVAREFGSGLNATISGAAWAMRQWAAKQATGGPVFLTYSTAAERVAFLADLDAVLAGDVAGWDIAPAAKQSEVA